MYSSSGIFGLGDGSGTVDRISRELSRRHVTTAASVRGASRRLRQSPGVFTASGRGASNGAAWYCMVSSCSATPPSLPGVGCIQMTTSEPSVLHRDADDICGLSDVIHVAPLLKFTMPRFVAIRAPSTGENDGPPWVRPG